MSSDSTRRRLALAGLLSIGLLLSGGLAPVGLAQDDPEPAEVTPTAEAEADDAAPEVDSERGTASVGGISAVSGGSAVTPDQPLPPPAAADPEPPVAEPPAAEERADQAPAAEPRPVTAGQAVEVTDPTGAGGTSGAGGAAEAAGDGGEIDQSATITGNNRGSTINVEDCAYGSVQIDGGTVVNASDVSLSANGGLSVSTANGGDDNIVRAGGAIASRQISIGAGNGGSGDSGANGGSINAGAMITGNNRGHEVNFADCPNGRGNAVLIVDAGDVTNTTTIDISANGGTAASDASGGSGNLGITGGLGGVAAGNGGAADSAANGGSVSTGAMITGNNRGNTITVGRAPDVGTTSGNAGLYSCLDGAVTMIIDGGDVLNDTSVNLSADGGTAIGGAAGGSDNLGLGRAGVVGNGGDAESAANGGAISVGSVITGNNRGNSITVGNVGGCATAPLDATAPLAAAGPVTPPKPLASQMPARVVETGTVGRAVSVQALPNTGTGQIAGTFAYGPLVAIALIAVFGSLRVLRRGRADGGVA